MWDELFLGLSEILCIYREGLLMLGMMLIIELWNIYVWFVEYKLILSNCYFL